MELFRFHTPTPGCGADEETSLRQVLIHGLSRSLKASEKRALERIGKRKISPEQVVSLELARELARVSREVAAQVGVLIDRRGRVTHVILGDSHQIHIPDLGRYRAGAGRFRGLRLVHTHLKGEALSADDLNDLALLRLDLVAVLHAKEDGELGAVEVAHLAPLEETASDAPEAEVDPFVRLHAKDLTRLDFDALETVQAIEAELARRLRGRAGRRQRERALVIGVDPDEDRFEETLELVRSADVEIASTIIQRRRRPHPRTVVGPGKISDIVLEGMRQGAEVAIFDVDLKPAQAKAFEKESGIRPIDRTQLILDVFAQRAKSRDGKLQVELAQLKYALPRLAGQSDALSRLGGGIGSRGPGETVLEVSRRRIRDRITALEKKIDALSKQRDLMRSRRRSTGIPVWSIVGYTNAGKSTLLNALTQSDVEAADKLFMTLDPTSRRLRFPREGEVVITDTVGFLADLPDDLKTAFRATLEELEDATLLLHVVDASDPQLDEKKDAVEALLEDLELEQIPTLLVLNKCDLLSDEQAKALERRFGGLAVSATKRLHLEELIRVADQRLGAVHSLLPEDAEVELPAGGATLAEEGAVH